MSSLSANNKKIAKNTIALYLRMGIVLVFSLYTTRIVLKNLGVEDYGIYNVVAGFVSLFSFLNSTLSSSVNRYYNYELGKNSKEGVRRVYNTSLLIQLLIACILILLLEIVGLWYINNYLVVPLERLYAAKYVFQCAVVSLAFTVIITPYSAAVLAYERMNFYAVISIVDAILKFGIALLLQFISYDRLCFYGLLIMIISIINFILYYVYCRVKLSDIRLSFSFDFSLFRSMLSFSGWSMLNPLGYTARSQGCNLIINYFFGPLLNAAYAITNQVSSAIDSFSMSVSVAFRPQLIQSYCNGDSKRALKLFNTSTKIMFCLILMLIVPLIINIDYILIVWLGNNVPQYTSTFCCIILIVKLVDSLNPSITNLILATGKIKKYMLYSSIIIASIVPISMVLFYFIEASPVLLFIIMLLLTSVNQVVSLVVLCGNCDFISLKDYFANLLMPCLLIAFIVYVIVLFISSIIEMQFIKLLMTAIASGLLTVLLAYWLLFDRLEKKSINKFFH